MQRAFFDLDGTIIENFSGLELARILTKLQKQNERWQEFWEKQKLLHDDTVSYDEAIKQLSHCFARCITNVETKLVQKGINELRSRLKVRGYFKDLHTWLSENRFETFVLTASPEEVFEALPHLHFTETFGLRLDRNDHYTGRLANPMTTEVKKKIIDGKNRNSTFSFGVSDSLQDIIAYESLDMRFLMNFTNLQKEKCQATFVHSFREIKRIVEDHLAKGR